LPRVTRSGEVDLGVGDVLLLLRDVVAGSALDGIGDGLVRVSIGLEAPEDLIEDFGKALA